MILLDFETIKNAMKNRPLAAEEALRYLVRVACDAEDLLKANDRGHFDQPLQVAGRTSAYVEALRDSVIKANAASDDLMKHEFVKVKKPELVANP